MADPEKIPSLISFTNTWHTEPYPFISPHRPELSAKGKNVLVTGGGTGIGKAIAIAFAQAGAKSVSIIGRRIDCLQSATTDISAAFSNEGFNVIYAVADLKIRDQVNDAYTSIVEQVGKIDILVSNAGAAPEPGVLADYDPKAFMEGLEANVLTTLNLVQAFIPFAGPEPVIISTSSAVAHFAPWPGVSAYSVAKAATAKMMDYVAAENPHLHVVNVQPGWVSTAMNGFQKEAPDSAELPGHFYVWLASPEAKFLNGKFVWANWDAEELVKRKEEIQGSKLLNILLEGVLM